MDRQEVGAAVDGVHAAAGGEEAGIMKPMTNNGVIARVYGCSDDLVEIECTRYEEDEIDCYDRDVRISFADGTIIRIGYPKKDCACWWIEEEEKGPAFHRIIECNDDEAEIYSDILEIDSYPVGHWVIPKKKEANDG